MIPMIRKIEKRDCMYCKNCGKEIDDKAVVCPGCGVPTVEQMPETKKKKKKHPILGGIILALGLLLIVGACSGGNEPEKVGTSNTNGQTAQTQPAKKTFSVGDKVELNDIVVTLKSVNESKGTQMFTPQDGKVFVNCEFEIENNSAKDIAVSSILCFQCYVDDYSTPMSLSAIMAADKGQLDGQVAAGKKMTGVIGYEADKGWSEIEIRFTPDFWAGKDFVFTATK